MRKIYLMRTHRTPLYTRGVLWVNGEIFHTLEPPWKDNQNNISCIPEGEYKCSFLERSASGKYTQVYHVQNVPNRTGILIHNGNVVDHTLGCILVGTRSGFLADKAAVLNSVTAKRKIAELTGKDPVKLIIQ